MYPVQPDSTVTVNCDENPLECHRCTGGGVCFELTVPPPSPIPVLPRAAPEADHHAPVRLLLTVTLLSAFLFLSLSLASLLLYRRRRRILRRRRRAAATAGTVPDDDWFGDGDEEGGGGGEVVHHVWYIRTVGLDDATIASIAAVEYRGGVGRGGDCAVCLGEFSDGELVRLLPRCAHPFHASCIDTWLRAHVNCPLCRSPVVVVPSDLPAADLEPGADVAQHEAREVLDEMPQSEVESQGEGSEDSEVSSDIESEDTAAAADDSGRVTPNPIRRSASMDSPLFLVPVPENQDDDTQCNRKLPNPSAQEMRVFRLKGKDASGISSSSCQASGFKIGRSMSSSGLGFFFSRSARSSGTVLPL
ncbi:hypothetical protein QOZ80_6AG0538300 [Eleusine coracana subsp. coracana]|nr:hypothetical protein QOZ80_6AG0538300 [Eleusine coracana subsp. coracana]